MRGLLRVLGMVLVCWVPISLGCEDSPPPASLLLIVNPVVNAAHDGPVLTTLATDRDGLPVRLNGVEGVTDASGLAVLDDVPAGRGMLSVGAAADALAIDAPQSGILELHVVYDGSRVETFEPFPIHHRVEAARVFGPSVDRERVEAALEEPGAIVLLEDGVRLDGLTVRGEGAQVYGRGTVVVEGEVGMVGPRIRLWGITAADGVIGTSGAVEQELGHCVFSGAPIDLGMTRAAWRNAFCSGTTRSAPTVLDNSGTPPVAASAACDALAGL